MNSVYPVVSILQAAKDVVLSEKPVIGDDSNLLDSSLLDELLANVATLSSVYHKPPEAFVTRTKIAQRTDEEDFPEGSDTGYSESPAHAGGALPPTTSDAPNSVPKRLALGLVAPPPPVSVPDLLGDLIGLDNNAIVPFDQPAAAAEWVNWYFLICGYAIKSWVACINFLA